MNQKKGKTPSISISSLKYDIKDKYSIIAIGFNLKKGPERDTCEGKVTYFYCSYRRRVNADCSP